MSLANLIASFLKRSDTHPVDEFISLDKDGNARFDLAAYLDSGEGQKRVTEIASDTAEEADDKVDKAA
jgi:hypothetical protein